MRPPLTDIRDSPLIRAARIAWELGGVLPRSVGTLAGSGDWGALSVTGLRQLGEVALDELVVTGMTLTGPPPQLPRPLGDYQPAADELATLSIDAAHPPPDALHGERLRPRRFGALTFEELVFGHEPALPASVLAPVQPRPCRGNAAVPVGQETTRGPG